MVSVDGPDEIIRKIRMDFSFFYNQGAPSGQNFEIDIVEQEPDYGMIPQGCRVFRMHPDFDFYTDGKFNYTKYAENCLTIYNKSSCVLSIYCMNYNIMHEITYLAVLTFSGENLERKGIFRIHGLSFMINGIPVVIISDSGVGKTMLFLELMKQENISFYSDEIVLINKDREILPFPLRIGLRREDSDFFSGIPERYLYGIERRKFGPKVLADSEIFKDRVAVPAEADVYIVARRHETGFLKRAGKIRLLAALLRNMVIGIGLPQLVEYLSLDFAPGDIIKLSKKAIRRLSLAISISLHSKVYFMGAAKDPAANLKMLTEEFCRE